MKITIFGKKYIVVKQKSSNDSVKLKNSKIIVNSNKKPPDLLLKEFLANLLYSQLHKIYNKIKNGKRIEIFGNLDFEIVEKIDKKKQRIAKIKGNKILVKLNAVALPKSALKYMIVHEIAHAFTKRHSEKFWKIVKVMYPDYEKGQRMLMISQSILYTPSLVKVMKYGKQI